MSGINRINSGSTLPLSTNFSIDRQTPNTSFGTRIQAGIGAATGVVGSGLGIAGSAFVGGPAIVSAAVSSATMLSQQRSSGAINTTYAHHTGFGPGLGTTVSPATGGGLGTTVVGGQGTPLGAPSGNSTVSNSMTAEAAQSGIDLNALHAKNMELLQIQSALQMENQTFSSLSNAMKTRHDTAKNSISNLR